MGRSRSRFWGRPRTSGGGVLGELIEALQPARVHTVAEAQARSAGVYGDHRQDADPLLRLMSRVDSPAWLPDGSHAEVWADSRPPRPTGLVRLLVVHRSGHVFCCRRDDGRPDLPTAVVPEDDPDGRRSAAALAAHVLGPGGVLLGPIGYVRNVVPITAPDYPWPKPIAHFTIWETAGTPVIDGEWLSLDPASPLSERHWFALLATQPAG